MKKVYSVSWFAFSILLLIACASQTLPSQPAMPSPRPLEKPPWQEDREKTLMAAKSEGKIVSVSSLGAQAHTAINKAFKEKFGLEAEFISGTASEILTKITRERSVGLYIPDIYLSGSTSMFLLKDRGFLNPIKPLLILPEAIEPQAWMDSQLKFLDKEELVLGYQVRAASSILVNSDMVKPDEIKSYKDLLSPKWKGKIVAYDPTIGSIGVFFFLILWEIMGPDFTREFGKQDLVITRDGRLQVEWLAQGKYPISGTVFSTIQTEFVKAGAPIKVILPVEGTLITASQGVVSLFNNAPHPNAAKIFINWLLTKEAQTLMSQITGDASRRLDVSKEWIDPSLLVRPGFKYINSDTEEFIKKRIELQKVSREVWNIK